MGAGDDLSRADEIDFSPSISQDDDTQPEFRIVKSPKSVMPDRRGIARGPIDVTLAPDFNNFMKLCSRQNDAASEDSD
jgi:hypothetical protein